jgi:hypothetical protein
LGLLLPSDFGFWTFQPPRPVRPRNSQPTTRNFPLPLRPINYQPTTNNYLCFKYSSIAAAFFPKKVAC